MSEFPSRIFSGVQPTGQLHLGNYLGAIIQFVELQHRMPSIYCIVDWHAMTVYQEPEALAGAVRQVASTYLAAGIDPSKAIIFKQSNIAELCELAWLFMCVARMGWLSRMTQFKEKVGKNRDNASLGLFAYPALMAADILLYRATHVPVGDDQRQHLELTRSIAQKFNHDYQDRICALGLGVADGDQPSGNGEGLQKYFPLTETVTDGRAPRVMSLRDASRKMSKSDPSDLSRIGLLDTEDEIRTKIRKAKTDPLPLPDNEDALDERPEASNLLGIYAALAGTDRQAVLSEFAGADFSNFKSKLADLAIAELQPIRQETVRLMNDPAHVDAVLEEGAERARAIARPVINEVKSICGLNG